GGVRGVRHHQRPGRQVLQDMRREAGLIAAAVAAAILSGARPAGAQPMAGGGAGRGMPDLRVINGKPLPDRGMAPGTVTVRVARKMPVNGVAGVEVSALIRNSGGDLKKRTAKT